MTFSGEVFDSVPEYVQLKSIMIDMFKGKCQSARPRPRSLRLVQLECVAASTSASGFRPTATVAATTTTPYLNPRPLHINAEVCVRHYDKSWKNNQPAWLRGLRPCPTLFNFNLTVGLGGLVLACA